MHSYVCIYSLYIYAYLYTHTHTHSKCILNFILIPTEKCSFHPSSNLPLLGERNHCGKPQPVIRQRSTDGRHSRPPVYISTTQDLTIRLRENHERGGRKILRAGASESLL